MSDGFMPVVIDLPADVIIIPENERELIFLLRQIVPGFAILASLYLAAIQRKDEDKDGIFELTEYKYSRTIYALLFGIFGGSAYMILNEHDYDWYPLLISEDEWMIVALLTLLTIEIAFFYIVVVTQRLEWPLRRCRHGLAWLCEKIRLERVARAIRREEAEEEREREREREREDRE